MLSMIHNNDITCPKVSTTAPWNYRGPLELDLEPDHCFVLSCGYPIVLGSPWVGSYGSTDEAVLVLAHLGKKPNY